jgi:hypothetical protein
MSYNHSLDGTQEMDGFLKALDILAVPYQLTTCGHASHGHALRMAKFTTPGGVKTVAEEWHAVRDKDCDGIESVALAVYPEGDRPPLVQEVVE